MARDSIFRVASITKSVTAAALLILVEEGRIALDDPIGMWLPELGKLVVVRTPASPVDDVVPADRPITVFDVLASQAGYGFPSDFTLPAVQELFTVQRDGRVPSNFPPADEWMAALGRIPLLYQPGAAWLYNTCSVLQGVLISRVTGQPLPEFLTERIFGPLGVDTIFEVPAAKRGAGSPASTGQAMTAAWSSPTARTASGVACPRYRSGMAGWPRPPTTGWPSAGCCWLAGWRPTAAGCYRPTPCA
ncbi:serine hydrolase domain-containing protein [Streptomyces tendae]